MAGTEEFEANCPACAQALAVLARIEEKMDAALVGNPSAGQPGIWIRLDRVEQFVRAALWLAGVALVTAAGAVASAFSGNK